MRLWTLSVFWMLVMTVVVKLLALAVLDYPRQNTERWHDVIDLVGALAFIAWGILAIWGR